MRRIYVASRSRPQAVASNLFSWLRSGIPVWLAVESQERDLYENFLAMSGHPGEAEILVLSESNRGIAFARQAILEHAASAGCDSIVQVDDDHRTPSNLGDLCEVVEEGKISGVGAFIGLYQKFLGMKPNTGCHIHQGGMGQQVVAVSPSKAIRAGGYNTQLHVLEDYDLLIKMVIKGGCGPWMIHSDVPVAMHGPKYQPGGIAATGDRDEYTRQAQAIMTQAYGPFFHLRTTKGRLLCWVQWKSLYKGELV